MAQFSGFLTNYANVSRSKNSDGLLPTDLMSNAVIVPSLNSAVPNTGLAHVQDGFIYLSNLLIQFSATTDASTNVSSGNAPLYFPISSKPYAVYGTGINTSPSGNTVINILPNSITDSSCNIRFGSNGGQLSWFSIGPAPTTPIYTNIVNSGTFSYCSGVAISSSGKYQCACVGTAGTVAGYIYINANYGYGPWLNIAILGSWSGIASDSTGQNLAACMYSGNIYTSNDYGYTWNQTQSISANCYSITSDSTGQYLAAVVNGIGIYTSSNYGSSWTKTSATNVNWCSITSDITGQYLAAVAIGDGIYTSSNYGSSWTKTSATNANWYSITSDSTGQYLAAVIRNTSNGGIYTSSNYGSTWNQSNAPSKNWKSITSNSTGQYLTAVFGSGTIYYSKNYGQTWNNILGPSIDYSVVDMNDIGNISTVISSGSGGTHAVYVSLNASN